MNLVGFNRIELMVNKPQSSQIWLHTFEQAESLGYHHFQLPSYVN